MAFFKKHQQKINDLWYPQAITVGKPVGSDQISDKLSLLSTVTRGDTFAVVKNFGVVMGDYMAQGRTVKVEGLGTFYYTAVTNKRGVDSAEKVSAQQISGVRVRFIPEVHRSSSNKVTTRTMVDSNIFWEEWGKSNTGSGNGGNTGGNTGGGSDGDENENPLG